MISYALINLCLITNPSATKLYNWHKGLSFIFKTKIYFSLISSEIQLGLTIGNRISLSLHHGSNHSQIGNGVHLHSKCHGKSINICIGQLARR